MQVLHFVSDQKGNINTKGKSTSVEQKRNSKIASKNAQNSVNAPIKRKAVENITTKGKLKMYYNNTVNSAPHSQEDNLEPPRSKKFCRSSSEEKRNNDYISERDALLSQGGGRGTSNQAYFSRPKQKSIIITYILWLFGGFFGLHHLYLHRDKHAFVWWCTLGGYFGIGWMSEIFLIPSYVRDANEDPRFVEYYKAKIRLYPKPPFSTIRFLGAIIVGYLFGELIQIAIPEEIFGGIDWTFLHWLIPLFISIGVWLVGNIGREKGTIWHCLIAAYVVYPIRYYVYDETYWFTATVFASAMVFDTYSKQWCLKPPRRHGLMKRAMYLSMAVSIYLSLWGCYFYFNGKITDSQGDEVPVHEAIRNFLASQWWTDFKQSLYDTYQFAQHHGWYEVWKQIFDIMDVDGEKNAYKVLGISATASQTEITAAWRKLSKENHPDKVKDSSKRKEAQERFMEIQQAYEVLSKIKSKRRQRNKKFNDDL